MLFRSERMQREGKNAKDVRWRRLCSCMAIQEFAPWGKLEQGREKGDNCAPLVKVKVERKERDREKLVLLCLYK